MKKIIIFLLTILCLIKYSNVEAQTSFYEAEKIDGIFTKSVNGTTSNYQNARVFRRTSDIKEAYCLEPFITFDENQSYDNYGYATNLDEATWERIALLAHYGYGYGNHTDMKWYAITQYLIWQIESPEIEHYFVSSLTSSTPIYPYEKEIAELKKLVVEKTKNISFFDNDHSTHKIEKDTFIEIFDKNEVVGNYKYVFSETLKIYHLSYKSITFKAEQEGEHILTFKQSYDYYHKPYTYYVSDSYQDMLEPGDLDELVNTFVFNTEDIEETPEQPDDNLENNSDKEEIEKEENSSNGNIEENKEEENENIPPENLETDKKDEETNPQPDNSNTDDALKGEENKDETDDNVHEDTENLDENIPDIKDDNFLTNLNGNTENSNSNYETIEATVPSTAANSFAIIYIFIIISSIILLKYAK